MYRKTHAKFLEIRHQSFYFVCGLNVNKSNEELFQTERLVYINNLKPYIVDQVRFV